MLTHNNKSTKKIPSFHVPFSFFLVSFLHLSLSEGSNILFWFGFPAYSHRLAVQPLMEKLAENHAVTFFAPYEPEPQDRHSNVTELSPKSLQEVVGKFAGNSNILEYRLEGRLAARWDKIRDLSTQICAVLMEDADYVDWIKTSQFDLVIIDALNNECGLGIAHFQKIPFVLVDTTTVFMWQYDMFGFPAETSWIPDLSVGYPNSGQMTSMSFAQRFMNTFRHLYWYYYTKVWVQYPKIERAINKGLDLTENEDHSVFSVREMELKTSLVLLNTHYSLECARSLPSLFVPVGGMHVVKANPTKSKGLPHAIKTFIDESGENGFIYVSFGTGVQISKAPLELQRQFFRAFGNSSLRFVWKWDGQVVPKEMPKNVITAKWMPQADILSSLKIRGFITHGGLLSIMEATTYGVPLIVLPVFAEQDYNAARVHEQGYGIRLEIVGLKQEQLESAIQSILQNPKYRQKMEYISRLFKDRESDPLTSAVWWTEYVLRHNSTPFLMPKSVYQYWFTRRLLDVWASVFGSVSLTTGIILGYCFRKRGSWKFPLKLKID